MTIRQSIQRRGSHAALLWRQGIWGKWIEFGWGVLYAGWAGWRAEWVKSADSDRYQIPAMIAHLSPWWGLVMALLILVCWIFEASFKAIAPLSEQLHELKKVDRWDLQNMLGGMFLSDTFMYPEGFWVKNYNNRFEIERLLNDFEMLTVRAPRNAVVNLHFRYLNSRQDSGGYVFYLLDGAGQTRAVDNIYGQIPVLLDDDARFGLKLVIDNDYEIADAASLLVSVATWTK